MSSLFGRKGFTLIELIVVITIISVLALMGIFSYSFIQENARNTRRKGDLKELKDALEIYKARHGVYPNTIGRTGCTNDWCGICSAYNTGDLFTDTGADGYIPNLAPEFIPKLPHDPREGNPNPSLDNGTNNCADGAYNCYLYRSNEVAYKLLANCTPEGTWDSKEEFYDPCRATWAWQFSSNDESRGEAGVTCDGVSTGW